MCNKPVHFIVSKVEDKASAMMTGKDPAEKVPSGFIESYTCLLYTSDAADEERLV